MENTEGLQVGKCKRSTDIWESNGLNLGPDPGVPLEISLLVLTSLLDPDELDLPNNDKPPMPLTPLLGV